MKRDPDERVSIPLDPEVALRALLQVKPDDPEPEAEKDREEGEEDEPARRARD